jgi:hypothetical protein
MASPGITLLILLFARLELASQRYGRPDAAGNYGRVQNAHVLLQVKVEKERSYFSSSDLKKMRRVRVKVSVVNPSTGAPHLL